MAKKVTIVNEETAVSVNLTSKTKTEERKEAKTESIMTSPTELLSSDDANGETGNELLELSGENNQSDEKEKSITELDDGGCGKDESISCTDSSVEELQLAASECNEETAVPPGILIITFQILWTLLKKPVEFLLFLKRNSWREALTKTRDHIVTALTERPEKEEFTSVDFAITLVEMVALGMSMFADWIVALMYFESCDIYWGTATILILFVPVIIINLFSIYWYKSDDHDCSTEALYFQRANKCTRPVSWVACVLSHFFLMGMFYRYWSILYFGMKTWSEEKILKRIRRAKQGSGRSFATVSTVVLDDDHFTATNTSQQDLESVSEGAVVNNWQFRVAPTYDSPPTESSPETPQPELRPKLNRTFRSVSCEALRGSTLPPSINGIIGATPRRKPRPDTPASWNTDFFDFYHMYLHQEHDVAFLDLINGFLHDGSQMVLQMYIIMESNRCACDDEEVSTVSTARWYSSSKSSSTCPKEHLKLYSQYQSAVMCLISLSWAYASYTSVRRYKFEQKKKINLLGMLVQFVWRVCTLVSRVGAFSLFAAGVPRGATYLLIGGTMHWMLMALWVRAQRASGDRPGDPGYPLTWKELLYDLVVGYMYLFCFFNVQDGSTRLKYLAFYSLVFVENLVMLICWYLWCEWSYRTIILVAMIMSFVMGVIFMMVYYVYTHPNSNLPNREVRATLY